MLVDFHDINDSRLLQFSVIVALEKSGFVYVKHKDRDTWEIPGGHIEHGETADEAAHRELKEETSALDYDLEPVCDYSINLDGAITYGRVYFALIRTYTGNLEHEIEQVNAFSRMPKKLTYPNIQPLLFQEVLTRIPEKIANTNFISR